MFVRHSTTPKPTTYKPIVIPDVDPAAFNEFHKWLVKDNLKVTDADLLCKSYLLAHSLRAEGMRNKLVDDVREYFANNKDVRVSLESMGSLSRMLPPHHVADNGQNRLLEFLVWQMTYEIVCRGHEEFENNAHFQKLLIRQPDVVKWHLKALHEMNPSQVAIRESKMREKKARERVRRDENAGLAIKEDEESAESDDGIRSGGRKMVMLHVPENPSKKVGCLFHEHLETKDCERRGRKRQRVVELD